jgi:PAS domain S-box-containing protein
MRFPKLSYPVAIVTIAAVYFGAGKLGLSMAPPGVDQITLVWPPTGISLAVLLIFGFRFWPGIALGAFLVNLTTPNEHLLSALGLGVGNTLQAVVGAWLLCRVVHFDNSLERLKDVVGLVVLAAGASTMVSATIGVSVLCLSQFQHWERFGELWSSYWLGDAMGVLVMAPVLLTWLSGPRPRWQTNRAVEAAVLGAGLILVCQFVFVVEVQAGTRSFPLEYTIFPFVIWAALRFGQRGVSLVIFMTSALVIAATLQSFGPFAKGKPYGDSLVLLQVFMGVLAVTGLLLGGVTSEARLVERRRSADFAIGQILAEASTLHEAAPRIMQTICEMLDWDLGALWMVDFQEANLHCVEMWHKPGVPIAEFVEANRKMRFQPGQGLPGHVWSLGRPAWIANVIGDANFPRAAIATRVGLHGAFGFPVLLHGRIVGVLEFFSRQIRSPDPDLLRMVAGIGGQLGQFIDRREAAKDRRSSEERLRLALGAGRMGVWDWNIRTGEIKWSDELESMHGLAPGSFAGTLGTFLDLIHPDDRELVNQAISRAVGEGRGYDIEFRNLWPDGSLHWIAGKGQVFHDQSGQAVRMIGIGMDITERKQAEKNLLESEQRLAAELEAITRLHALSTRLLAADNLSTALDDVLENAIVTSGADFGNIQLYNAQVGALEIVAHRGFGPDFLDYFRLVRVDEGSACAQAMQSGQRIIIEDVVLDPTYERHRRIAAAAGYRAVQSTPLKSRNGSILGMLSTHFRLPQRVPERNQRLLDLYARHAADLIERIRIEQTLKEADRRKDEFLAMLAHELRNPLAPIRNALKILQTQAAEPHLLEMARDVMDRQTQQLTRLVDDLMDVSRITRGKINLCRDRIELAAVVKRAVETARPLMEEHQHDFIVNLPTEPIFLNGDLIRLAQALANVLNNAAKYTEKGGRVSLSAERNDNQVVICVRDTGIGIPPEILPHIFDLFTQADRALDRSQGGLGIGLTLVRTLVEMHGGTVQAASAGPGQGSEFILRLPALPTPPQNGKSPYEKSVLWHERLNRKVLIIDDNRDSTETLATLMRIWHHEVQTAHDGPSALAAAKAFQPQVVFLDIGLPGMNGFEVAKHLRRLPDLPRMLLVALSGYGQDGDRFQAHEAGFDHYLVKPVLPEVLRDFLIGGTPQAKEPADKNLMRNDAARQSRDR